MKRWYIAIILFSFFVSGCTATQSSELPEGQVHDSTVILPYHPSEPPPLFIEPVHLLPPASRNPSSGTQNPDTNATGRQPVRSGSDTHSRSGSTGTPTPPAPSGGRSTQPVNTSNQNQNTNTGTGSAQQGNQSSQPNNNNSGRR